MLFNQSIKTSDITVILLLYNTPEKKLQNLQNYKEFNFLILDQSGDYITKEKVFKLLPNISYYKVSDQNKGFAKGINFLSKKVKTKFFLCTQVDVKINIKSIIELKKAFLKKKDCIISVPNFRTNKKIKKNKSIAKINKFIGAIFLTEKSKFDKIGKFDENFFFYWEDEDLSKRIEKSKKFNIYKCFNSFSNHNNGNSTKTSKKNYFIRTSNFKFGEYLYQYKNNKLKLIKLIREPILRIFLIILYAIFFKKSLFYRNLYLLLGILKFFKILFLNSKLK